MPTETDLAVALTIYSTCYAAVAKKKVIRTWTSQSIPQPVPSPDKRGGLASGASRL